MHKKAKVAVEAQSFKAISSFSSSKLKYLVMKKFCCGMADFFNIFLRSLCNRIGGCYEFFKVAAKILIYTLLKLKSAK